MQAIRKNLTTLLIVLATVVLAGVAIYTAIRLYQTRQGSIAPTAPTSKPAAATLAPSAAAACQTLAFTLTAPTGSPTATPTATASPTASPTPVPQCGTACSTNSDCPSSMVCYVGACRNPSCTTSTNCVCATTTPTPTPTVTPTQSPIALASVTPTPTAKPALPTAGSITPTVLGIGGGLILLLTGIALLL